MTRASSERQVRIELAACYRLVAHFGMDDLVYTHISARLPGKEEHFLINPYGMMFHEVCASDLVKIDLEGNLVGKNAYPVNKAGFVIHSAVHMARPDIMCVLHTHTRAGVAVSCTAEGLLPLNQFALQFYDRIAYHDYEGVALEEDERARLVADLGAKPVMILRNHGLLAAGRSIAEAFSLMYYLDQACRIQIDAKAMGGKIVLPPSAVRKKTAKQFQGMAEKPQSTSMGQREWPALLRLCEKLDPGYKD
ncbi:MAG: class II aldolase/adducin family protein [Proteobacteria bacterium]|nr:class II aldolase/adducin family protein [Pseudomonadota bacterium]MBI3499785.1 class II aldolase/adducin family protein [Pseudomonadota bacterium]